MKIIRKRIGQGVLGVLIAANGVPAALAVEVPTASGIKLDILTQGKFQKHRGASLLSRLLLKDVFQQVFIPLNQTLTVGLTMFDLLLTTPSRSK